MGTFFMEIYDLICQIGPWIIYMFCVPRVLHIFQMEGYNYKDYMRWLPQNGKNLFVQGLWQFLACFFYWLVVLIININVKGLTISQMETIYVAEALMFLIVLGATNVIQICRDRLNMKNAEKTCVYRKS